MANEEFLRTPTQARGRVTDEEREKIAKILKKWLAIGLRTDPVVPELIIPAIKGLYRVANLEEPHVEIVSSPIVAVIAGTLGVGVLYIRKNDTAKKFSENVITHAIHKTIQVAVEKLNLNKTIYNNIVSALDGISHRKTETVILPKLGKLEESQVPTVASFLLKCIQRWFHMYQGGNMWPGASSYLESMRDVIGLTGLPGWDAYKWWEDCAKHGSFRVVHREFCIVSDFPEYIEVDDKIQQHCEKSHSHKWRDGWALWHWHGIIVTQKIIESPETITIDEIRNQNNAEIRRVMITRMGWDKFVSQAKVKVIHNDSLVTKFPSIPVSELVDHGSRLVTSYRDGKEDAELILCEELTDFEGRPLVFVRLTDPSTGRQYILRTKHYVKRCYEAVGISFGITEDQYKSGIYLRQGDVMLRPLGNNPNLQQQHS